MGAFFPFSNSFRSLLWDQHAHQMAKPQGNEVSYMQLRESPVRTFMVDIATKQASFEQKVDQARRSVWLACFFEQCVSKLKRKIAHFFSGFRGDF